MSTRGPNGHFVPGNEIGAETRIPKGKTLNPGGRLRRVREIRELALNETEASFRVLFEIRDNTSEDSRARIAACKEIIRYGIGDPKAVEPEKPSDADMGGLTIDELRNLARQSLADESEANEDDDADDSDETVN